MSFSAVDPVAGPSSIAPVPSRDTFSDESSLVPAIAHLALASSQTALNDPREIDETFYERLQANSFSLCLSQAIKSCNWGFIETLCKRKPSDTRFSAPMLADLEKGVPQHVMSPLKPQLLEEIFFGSEEETLQIGLKHPAYFLQWCFTHQNLPLLGEFLKKLAELPAHSIPTLFWVLDQFSISFDFSREVRRLVLDLLRKKEVSTELVLALAKRATLPIQADEYQYLTELKQKFPQFKNAFDSWGAVQKETDTFDFERLEKRSVSVGSQSFEVYETDGTPFQFLVYSQTCAKVDCEEILKERVRNGFLCTSLISNLNASFYHCNDQYAMVLSVDPGYLIKTSCQDVSAPYVPHNENTLGFYRLHDRLLLLTAYIDDLYQRKAKQKGERGDEYARLHSLMAYKHQYQENAFDLEIQRLKVVLGISQETDYDLLLNREEKGQSWIQLHWLLSQHQDDPQMVEQLLQIQAFLKELQRMEFLETHPERGDLAHAVQYIQPLQTPQNLLDHTVLQNPHPCGDGVFMLYNEVNLNFQNETSKRTPPTVKAIFIDRHSFDQNPRLFGPILSQAKKRNLPVLMHQASQRFASVFRQELKRLATFDLSYYSINKLLAVQKNWGEEDLYEAVMEAIHHPPSIALPNILDIYPHFSVPFIEKAFKKALERHNAPACAILLDWFFPVLKDQARPILQTFDVCEEPQVIDFSDRRLALLQVFLKKGEKVDGDTLGNALCYAVSIGDKQAVRHLLCYAHQIDNLYMQEAIRFEQDKRKQSLSPFDGVDPRKHAQPAESLLSDLLKAKPECREENTSFLSLISHSS